jgi:hypothetical protein
VCSDLVEFVGAGEGPYPFLPFICGADDLSCYLTSPNPVSSFDELLNPELAYPPLFLLGRGVEFPVPVEDRGAVVVEVV